MRIQSQLISWNPLVSGEQNNLKFYIEFEPCKECKAMIREFNENSDDAQIHEDSKKFLRHLTYNHSEIVQAIVKDFPKEAKREDYSWFR